MGVKKKRNKNQRSRPARDTDIFSHPDMDISRICVFYTEDFTISNVLESAKKPSISRDDSLLLPECWATPDAFSYLTSSRTFRGT